MKRKTYEVVAVQVEPSIAYERRKALRVTCTHRVEWADAQSGLTNRGVCTDLSQSGMCITTVGRVRLSQVDDLRFFLWADGSLLKVPGRIVRQKRGVEFGIEFLFEGKTLRDRIGRQLETEADRERRFEVRQKEVDIFLRSEGKSLHDQAIAQLKTGQTLHEGLTSVRDTYIGLHRKWLDKRITTHL